VTPILRIFWPNTQIFNAASASIVVGIMILPMMASLCDDALTNISKVLREGAYALGAHSFEVIFGVVIPAAFSRIFAAFILAVSRAVGETMAVALAAGSTPKLTLNPLESVQTMTGYIVQVSMGDTPAGGVEYLTAFTVAALLFLITFVFNMAGAWIMSKGFKRL
jgi:phosphate transport system permease protein